MAKILKIKPVVNKNNGQINFSLPKKKLSKDFVKNTKSMKGIKIKLLEWF